MKKIVPYMLAGGLLSMSCSSSTQMQGLSVGTSVGAVIGSSIGGIMGGFRGHDMGGLVGAVTGGIVGAAMTAPRDKQASGTETAAPRTQQGQVKTGKAARDAGRAEEPAGVTVTTPASASESPLVLRNLRYIDDGRNQTLNRKESSKVIFELMNPTHAPVTEVVPYVSEANGNSQIYISPSVRIESIGPGEGVRYTAEIKGGNRLKTGTATFRIAVSCDEGPFVTLREFTLPTGK